MGRVGFRGRTRRYTFLLVRACSGAGVDGATPRRRPACVIFGGFPRQLRHRVPDLSAYATKMRVPLLRASKWKFTRAGEDWFCFAGLWRPMPERGEAFTLLTTAPGPDVAPIHDRQMVVLHRTDWSAWLEFVGKEADLLRPLPAGSLRVQQVR